MFGVRARPPLPLPLLMRASATVRNQSSGFLHDLFSLQGRACIVTGGGTGIGAALSTGLARAGALVVVTGRRASVLEETVTSIHGVLEKEDNVFETRVFAVPCDITDGNKVGHLVREAEARTGVPPTILVNNAGINVRQAASNLTSAHWDISLSLMLTAPAMMARAMSANMQASQHGRIVNLASLQSFAAFPDSIPYASAKSGTLGLTRALAEAYSPPRGYENVTCNAIAPGYVRTELTKAVFDDVERSETLAAATILGRNSVPNDLVGATVFLCSPASSYVTGQTLPVDGGFTALGVR